MVAAARFLPRVCYFSGHYLGHPAYFSAANHVFFQKVCTKVFRYIFVLAIVPCIFLIFAFCFPPPGKAIFFCVYIRVYFSFWRPQGNIYYFARYLFLLLVLPFGTFSYFSYSYFCISLLKIPIFHNFNSFFQNFIFTNFYKLLFTFYSFFLNSLNFLVPIFIQFLGGYLFCQKFGLVPFVSPSIYCFMHLA